jgi:hypothetical protein
MRPKITALLLSGALLAGALGTAATAAGGATVMWENPKLRVTEKLQPLTITFKNKIARAIRFRCRFLLDSEWSTARGRLRPLAKIITQPANGTTASQFSCRTRLAG